MAKKVLVPDISALIQGFGLSVAEAAAIHSWIRAVADDESDETISDRRHAARQAFNEKKRWRRTFKHVSEAYL